MEHVVFFPGHDGAPSFRRLQSLEDAVRFVEHLRNVEGVSEVSVHSLAPVPLSFRPYYRVEVPAGEQVAEAAEAAVEPVASVEPAAPVAPVAEVPAELVAVVPAPSEPVGEHVPAPADAAAEAVPAPEPVSNGRRSLGFFTH
jgi:hypothetical protein